MNLENSAWDEFIISTIARMPDQTLRSNCLLYTYRYGRQVLPFTATGNTGISVVIVPEDYPGFYCKSLNETGISFIVTKPGMTVQELTELVKNKQRNPFWLSFLKWLIPDFTFRFI